ncbi:MAG: NADH-quinone oxidoreductase subunit NuoK [bacterium]
MSNLILSFFKDFVLNVGLTHFLCLAAVLFCIGFIGLISSRNFIRVLMSLEILLNAVNINFIAFSAYCDPNEIRGQVFAIFIMAISAAEAALGLAILLSFFRKKPTVDVEEFRSLKG